MSDLPRIALIGKMGSGKTTAARLLIQHFGYRRLAFADELREHTHALWGRELGEERARLQRLGQAVRDIDPDTWVRLLIARLDSQYAGVEHHPPVVDDVRYHNEAWALKGEGFTTVRIVADKARRIERVKLLGKLTDEAQLIHLSETDLDDWPEDYKVRNTGTQEQMLKHLTRIVNAERGA